MTGSLSGDLISASLYFCVWFVRAPEYRLRRPTLCKILEKVGVRGDLRPGGR